MLGTGECLPSHRLTAADGIARDVLQKLGEEVPEETEILWALAGALIGILISLALLWSLGKVQGLTSPGITSGLASIGALFGGGMCTGICLLFFLPALSSIAGYAVAHRKNQKQLFNAARKAVVRLRKLQRDLSTGGNMHEADIRALEFGILVLETNYITSSGRHLFSRIRQPGKISLFLKNSGWSA